MSSPVLFSTGASPAASSSRSLVEFKAGKMEMRDKMVHPIKKQGQVYLHQSPDDNLMHFCWKDRSSGVVEDDLILFPDDCEFKRVKECSTGRVYVLKMNSSKRKMFFWMQESATDKDDEYCRKINEYLNNPPRQSMEQGSSERDLQSLLGSMTQEQMAQLLSSNGMLTNNLADLLSSAAARSPSANSGASASSTMSTTQSAPHSATSAISGASSPTDAMFDLSTVINSESLAHLLADQEFLKQIEQHLPPVSLEDSEKQDSNDKRKNQFQATVRSQQFRSSIGQFCAAFQSGQLGPLMSQFGLSSACITAANDGNLEEFVRALEADQKKQTAKSEPSNSNDQS